MVFDEKTKKVTPDTRLGYIRIIEEKDGKSLKWVDAKTGKI